jgi:hypothetical protein
MIALNRLTLSFSFCLFAFSASTIAESLPISIESSSAANVSSAETCTAPTEITPTDSGILNSNNQQVSWNNTNCEYWVYAGTSPRNNTYSDSGSLGSATSFTITGYEVDGSTVYVTLYYRSTTGGTWSSKVLEYTTALDNGIVADIVINELMAKNDSQIPTGYGEEDWIELKNNENEAVDLTGWCLKDSDDQWCFPANELATIDANGYLLLIASGDGDSVTDTQYQHTNFKLSKGGEYLGLFSPSGATVDEYNPFPELEKNEAFGLDNNGNEAIFSTATPGTANQNSDFPECTTPKNIVPSDNGILSGNNQEITWDNTNCEYWVYAGPSAKSKAYSDSGNLNNTTSYTISGYPSDGSDVYVTLYYRPVTGGVWQNVVLTYTQPIGECTAPSITTTVDDATFEANAQTLEWNQTNCEYWVYAGTARHKRDYADSGSLGSSTTYTVSGYPSDGSTIYVTLYYKPLTGGNWKSAGSTYQAPVQNCEVPEILSPTNGGSLNSDSQLITWTNTACEYWVYAGPSPGNNSYSDSESLGNTTSFTVNGYPKDGSSVYVRLYYRALTGGRWQSITAEYTAPQTLATLPLRINEFLASNDKDLEDEEGENNDWIEILNTGSTAINLEGVYLTDDDSELNQWSFPSHTLAAGELVVVFASGEDRKESPPYHTNFKLKAGGEYLAIVNTDGNTVIDNISPEYPNQYTDISYGLDDQGNFKYFENTTPGEQNPASGYQGYLQVEFSESRGFHDAPFELMLSTPGGNAPIRYTLDGEEPTASNGTLYTAPITINSTSVVRAYSEKSGYLSPVSTTHSYIFIQDVVNQPENISGYPNNQYNLGSGGAKARHDYGMDATITQHPDYATDLLQGLLDIPSVSLAVDPSHLFGNNGFYDTDNIEVPISFEVLYAGDKSANHQVNAGAESHSHKRLKRSMRVNFRTEYGYSKLDSDLLQRAPVNGGSATDKFDRLILRAGNNRSWARNWNPDDTAYTVDQFYRDTQIAVSGIGSHGMFVHLYINSLYWGLYNVAERPDDNFAAEYLGGDDDDFFFIKHASNGSGDDSRYETLTDDLLNRNLSNQSNYDLLKEYLDVEKYIDYILINWYTAVSDWPQNNFYGGNRNDSSNLGSTPFQYYAWDGEWSWKSQRSNSNPSGRARVHPSFKDNYRVSSNDPMILRIWHSIRENSSFMTQLRQRVDELTADGGPLSDAASAERWSLLNSFIENAIVAESARWGDSMEGIDSETRTRDDHWQHAVDQIEGFIQGNATALKDSMSDQGYY